MRVHIVGQEPLEVTIDEGRSIVKSIASGAEFIIIGDEYVKASTIMGIRNDAETIPTSQWGMLPEGRLERFFDDNREPKGDGYKKFQEMKRKLLSK